MSPSPTQPQGPSSLATRYALLGPLATSASATRYAAIDRRLARPVTLTLFHREHAGCAAARGSLAAWTRFEYGLARAESRRASALDPAWLPLQLLMSFVPETDAGDP